MTLSKIDTDKLYEAAWIRQGQDSQLLMLVEEMSELTTVICHN